jgi:hypothetical protein
MFPTGTAGVALILLRVSVAATIFTEALPQGDTGTRIWVVTIACCLVEVAMLLDGKNLVSTPLFSSILIAASLGLLGPGAYSLDARMFGRRLVVSSSDKNPSGD